MKNGLDKDNEVYTYIRLDVYVGIQQQALHKSHQWKEQWEVIKASCNLQIASTEKEAITKGNQKIFQTWIIFTLHIVFCCDIMHEGIEFLIEIPSSVPKKENKNSER